MVRFAPVGMTAENRRKMLRLSGREAAEQGARSAEPEIVHMSTARGASTAVPVKGMSVVARLLCSQSDANTAIQLRSA
jgi:hypothetical protein